MRYKLSSKISSQCISCILNKHITKFPETASECERIDYMKGVLKIISENDDFTAPEITALITNFRNEMFGYCDEFAEVKTYFNNLMLSMEEYFERHIRDSKTPFETALKFSMLGNYIDFGALKKVDEERLYNIPNDVNKIHIDNAEYEIFLSELEKAGNLVYLTDNCGEIEMDKLFIKEILKIYPNLKITVIVKGGAVLNDATIEDAKTVGLTEIVSVIDNGNNIAGTVINKMSKQSKAVLEAADLIISKGQANFETLIGCDKNVYYLFLCKCSLYSNRFNVPQFTGMFLNDKRINRGGLK